MNAGCPCLAITWVVFLPPPCFISSVTADTRESRVTAQEPRCCLNAKAAPLPSHSRPGDGCPSEVAPCGRPGAHEAPRLPPRCPGERPRLRAGSGPPVAPAPRPAPEGAKFQAVRALGAATAVLAGLPQEARGGCAGPRGTRLPGPSLLGRPGPAGG